MKSITYSVSTVILLCGSIGLSQTPAATSQAPPSEASPAVPKRRFFVGLRGRDFPLHQYSNMQSRTTLATTTVPTPVRDWTFTTSSHSPSWGAGPVIECVLNPTWTVSAEVLYNRLRYTKVTGIYWGTDDPTTTADERNKMFRNEDTRAVLWDLPVMVHHRGIGSSGPLSRVYVSGGATARTATNLKSSTVTTNQDTSTSTANTVVQPSRRNLLGAVVGVGFRITDDFNINWTPEIRYTRWAGRTFGSDSTLSPRNQIEVGMAFTF